MQAAQIGTPLAEWAHSDMEENLMGKYFIAWLLGVPAAVLVVAYFFFS